MDPIISGFSDGCKSLESLTSDFLEETFVTRNFSGIEMKTFDWNKSLLQKKNSVL